MQTRHSHVQDGPNQECAGSATPEAQGQGRDLGQTLSDYLLAEIERLAARPTREEMLTRIHGRKRVTLKTPAAAVIREERESA
jgi:hypothetical protein